MSSRFPRFSPPAQECIQPLRPRQPPYGSMMEIESSHHQYAPLPASLQAEMDSKFNNIMEQLMLRQLEPTKRSYSVSQVLLQSLSVMVAKLTYGNDPQYT